MAKGGPPRRLYENCTQVVMRPGDTLYMPAGQVHASTQAILLGSIMRRIILYVPIKRRNVFFERILLITDGLVDPRH